MDFVQLVDEDDDQTHARPTQTNCLVDDEFDDFNTTLEEPCNTTLQSENNLPGFPHFVNKLGRNMVGLAQKGHSHLKAAVTDARTTKSNYIPLRILNERGVDLDNNNTNSEMTLSDKKEFLQPLLTRLRERKSQQAEVQRTKSDIVMEVTSDQASQDISPNSGHEEARPLIEQLRHQYGNYTSSQDDFDESIEFGDDSLISGCSTSSQGTTTPLPIQQCSPRNSFDSIMNDNDKFYNHVAELSNQLAVKRANAPTHCGTIHGAQWENKNRNNDRFLKKTVVQKGATEEEPDKLFYVKSNLLMPKDKRANVEKSRPPVLFIGNLYSHTPVRDLDTELVRTYMLDYTKNFKCDPVMLGGECIDPTLHWVLPPSTNENTYNMHIETPIGEKLSTPISCSHEYFSCSCHQSYGMSLYGLESVTIDFLAPIVYRHKDVIAAFHDFGEAARGNICSGEIAYQLMENFSQPCHKYTTAIGNVNLNYYVGWRNMGRVTIGPYNFSWKVLTKLGDTVILHLYATKHKVKQLKNIPFDRAMADHGTHGTVDLRGVAQDTIAVPAVLESLQINDAVCLSCGPYLMYIIKDTTRVMVPKGLVSQISVEFGGLDKTPDNWRLCLRKTKQLLSNLNYTAEVKEQMFPIVSALGFSRAMKTNVGVWTAILGPMLGGWFNIDWFKTYNNVLNLKFPKILYKKYIIIALAICIAIALVSGLGIWIGDVEAHKTPTSTGVTEHTKPAISPAIELLPNLTFTLLLLMFPMFKYIYMDDVYIPHKHKKVRYPDHCCQDEIDDGRLSYLPPNMIDGKLDGVFKGPEHVRCVPGIGTSNAGPTLANYRPHVPRSCTHNAEIAIRNRAIIQRQPDDEDYWDEVRNMVHLNWILLFGEPHEIQATPFPEWVNRFPIPRRKILSTAHKRYKLNGDQPWENFEWKNESFIKRECLNKWYYDLTQAFSPRLIQGRTPLYQVATGPWTHAFSSYLKMQWNAEHFITYSSGMNANQLGTWYTEAIEHVRQFGEPVAVEDDMGRWDGRYCEEAITTEFTIYNKFLNDARIKRALSMQYMTKGTLRFKEQLVRYKVSATRKSGDGNTSGGNSLGNGLLHLDLLKNVGVELDHPSKVPFRIMVLGDDMLLITTREIADKVMANIDRLKRSSMEPEIFAHSETTKASYCSGYYYPSDKGVIWGPKIGRCITKIFHCRHGLSDVEEEKWARGVALGLVRDTHHIPVIRAIVKAVLDRTKHLGNVPVIQGEKHRPHASIAGTANHETYGMLFDVYGLGKQDFDIIESHINTEVAKNGLHVLLRHPLLHEIVEHDTELK